MAVRNLISLNGFVFGLPAFLDVNFLSGFFQGSKLYVFPCNRWLARDEEDKEIVRELVPEKIIKETIRKDGEVEKKEVKVKDKLISKSNRNTVEFKSSRK